MLTNAIAVFATLSFCAVALVLGRSTKPRLRWIVERLFFVTVGMVLGAMFVLATLEYVMGLNL